MLLEWTRLDYEMHVFNVANVLYLYYLFNNYTLSQEYTVESRNTHWT